MALLINIYTSMMEKNVHKLYVKFATPFLKFINVIFITQNISVLIAAMLCSYGNTAKIVIFTNVITIIVQYIFQAKTNSISANVSFKKLGLLNSNFGINSVNIISLNKILLILRLNRITILPIYGIHLILSPLF